MTKRAVEICRDQHLKKNNGKFASQLTNVTYQHVNDAFTELYNSKTCQVLRSLRKYEVLIIFAIYLELIISKAEKVLMDKVYTRCLTMI